MAKPYHHGNLRIVLLQAGVRLLEKRGATHLSLRELAKEAGVSHTAPYRHFKDKASLLTALAQVGYERLAEAMEATACQFADDPRRQIREAGIAYILMAVRNPQLFHLMFGGIVKTTEYTPELNQAAQRAFGGLTKIINNGQEAGIYRSQDGAGLALAAWSLVHGLSTLVNAGLLQSSPSSEEQLSAIADSVCNHLLCGMLG